MKYFLVTTASLVLSAFAQTTSQTPACASSCNFYAAASVSGTCSSTGTACLCSSQKYVSSFESCVLSSCDASDIQSALDYGVQNCAVAGVTIAFASSTSTVTSRSSTSTSMTSTRRSTTATITSSISVTSSSSTKASQSATSTSTSSTTTASSTQVSSQTTATSQSSRDGKWIGIGVGAGLAFAILIGCILAWWIARRFRKVKQNQSYNTIDTEARPSSAQKNSAAIQITTDPPPAASEHPPQYTSLRPPRKASYKRFSWEPSDSRDPPPPPPLHPPSLSPAMPAFNQPRFYESMLHTRDSRFMAVGPERSRGQNVNQPSGTEQVAVSPMSPQQWTYIPYQGMSATYTPRPPVELSSSQAGDEVTRGKGR